MVAEAAHNLYLCTAEALLVLSSRARATLQRVQCYLYVGKHSSSRCHAAYAPNSSVGASRLSDAISGLALLGKCDPVIISPNLVHQTYQPIPHTVHILLPTSVLDPYSVRDFRCAS